jgi:hypothetical protein
MATSQMRKSRRSSKKVWHGGQLASNTAKRPTNTLASNTAKRPTNTLASNTAKRPTNTLNG